VEHCVSRAFHLRDEHRGEIPLNEGLRELRYFIFIMTIGLAFSSSLFGQTSTNCFLEDAYPKYISPPLSKDTIKPSLSPSVLITVNGSDTLSTVSNYVMGNAAAVWVGANINNPTLIPYLQLLSPTLIRFPGGSWSDIYFRNGVPSDIPDSIYDGTKYNATTGVCPKTKLWPENGQWYGLTLDNYYDLRDQIGAQGLITINYGYARYGLSANPIGQAAHLAADWVRYDAGRTKYWEIGNEVAGAWEAGWIIDTAKNLDKQPRIITGRLYGKHFKIFVDSMKAAAALVGSPIYIGGVIDQFDATNYSMPDKTWNQDFFNEVGDSADFYVIHEYFGNSATTAKAQVDNGKATLLSDINFVNSDIARRGAHRKPIALTEWNCGGPDAAKISIANGMQAVVQMCEMLKTNVGMSCRWLIANDDNDGMFYYSSNPIYPLWNPRPDFYSLYYLRSFIGDHMVNASTSYSDVLTYASRFSSGQTGVVVVNKGGTTRAVEIDPIKIGVGKKYYVYSLKGNDASEFPTSLSVNNIPPTAGAWGPLSGLSGIKAWSFSIGDTICFESPAKSIQYVLIDNGSRILTGVNTASQQIIQSYSLEQNYPNPFNPTTEITFSVPQQSTVTVKIYDLLGREVKALLNYEKKAPGTYHVDFDGALFPSGVYFYRFSTEHFSECKKMLLVK